MRIVRKYHAQHEYPEEEKPCTDKPSRWPHCFLCQIYMPIAFIIGCQSISEAYLASESLIYLNYDLMLINAERNFKMYFSIYFSVVKHDATSHESFYFSLHLYTQHIYNKSSLSQFCDPNYLNKYMFKCMWLACYHRTPLVLAGKLFQHIVYSLNGICFTLPCGIISLCK